MRELFFIHLTIALFVLITSCSEDDTSLEDPGSGNSVLIDEAEYQKKSHDITIQSAVIKDNSLTVIFSFSGCDDNVSTQLVDEGKISQVSPPERNLKLLVGDVGDCEAVFSKTVTFDLSPALINGQPNIHFNLEGWDYRLVHQLVPGPGKCDSKLLVSPDKYQKDSHPIDIQNIVASENCLEVTFSFSGCSDDVGMQLIDRGIVAESNPVQRWLKLVVEDAGICRAVFSVKKSFDLSPVRGVDEDAIIFHLDGWDEPFRYDY